MANCTMQSRRCGGPIFARVHERGGTQTGPQRVRCGTATAFAEPSAARAEPRLAAAENASPLPEGRCWRESAGLQAVKTGRSVVVGRW